MPLILKVAGERIYLRGNDGQPQTQLYGLKNWTYIQDRAEVANLFRFDVAEPCVVSGDRYTPGLRDEVLIYRSEWDYTHDVRWFGGLITQVEELVTPGSTASYAITYRIEAQSFDILLDKEVRQPQKAGLTWDALLKKLLAAHFSTQLSDDFSYIQNPILAPPIRINNGSIRTLLKAMRQLTNYDYFVDAYKRLHVFRAIERPGSFVIDDEPASGLTVWDTRPSISYAGRSIYNIIRQPFQNYIEAASWDGESFIGKGDPKGQGGQLPLLRTPEMLAESIHLQDKFDGPGFDSTLWIESDVTTTQHVDYPNQGYLFCAQGQCQLVGGTGTLGGVALVSQDFYPFIESAYIVQEFQLTNAAGEGYIALFTDGSGVSTVAFQSGLKIENGALKALDNTTLIASLGTTRNYLLWVTMTPDGWQYDIQGGAYATKTTIRTETGITHLPFYKLAAVINKNMQGSINSFRFRQSDLGVSLEINGQKKVVALETSDTDLPDIDAFLNLDETPTLLKFRGAQNLAVIASALSTTQFTVAAGQESLFQIGHRLLIGNNIIEEFNGKAGIVSAISGSTITLVSPGVSGLSSGQQILINTTLPAKNDKIVVKYGYTRADEAVAYDQTSVNQYGPLAITLEPKDHIRQFDDAQAEAENFLSRYKEGILTLQFTSNNRLIPDEPEPMTAITVKLMKRPQPIHKTLILQRIEITPKGGTERQYFLHLESADPIRPFDALFQNRSLVIGADGAIRLSVNLSESVVSDCVLVLKPVSSLYITWDNPESRTWGEFTWKP